MRPKATAVPTPVARTELGYTCAASAYIVVCTPLIMLPVSVSIATIGTTPIAGEMVIALSPSAPATATPVIVNIAARDPNRAIASPPSTAPTTPPRLKAVMPVLAVPASKPAPVRSEVSQLKPR